MIPAAGIKGPNLEDNVSIPIPPCIKIETEKDNSDVKEFVSKIINNTNNNAVKQLQDLLGDQAPELVEHLKKRLNC